MTTATCGTCAKCGKEIAAPRGDGGTGYGTYTGGDDKVCYSCCAEIDKHAMIETGRATLYLSRDSGGDWHVTNWPGSLALWCFRVSIGRHNIAGSRTDVWFIFGGKRWHGVQYGENTQLCHCKRMAS